MYILYPPSSSGITSMIHMKVMDIRFANTISKWTQLKLVCFSEGSLFFLNQEEQFAGRICTWQKSNRSSLNLQLAVNGVCRVVMDFLAPSEKNYLQKNLDKTKILSLRGTGYWPISEIELIYQLISPKKYQTKITQLTTK